MRCCWNAGIVPCSSISIRWLTRRSYNQGPCCGAIVSLNLHLCLTSPWSLPLELAEKLIVAPQIASRWARLDDLATGALEGGGMSVLVLLVS